MERGKANGSTSLLSKKVDIAGEIQGNEDLHVEGRFKGSIKISGNIFVGPTGVVDADVEAENIIHMHDTPIGCHKCRIDRLAAAGRGARTVDLGGRVVLPGFVEPHMHFALLAGLGHLADIGPFQRATFDGALEAGQASTLTTQLSYIIVSNNLAVGLDLPGSIADVRATVVVEGATPGEASAVCLRIALRASATNTVARANARMIINVSRRAG